MSILILLILSAGNAVADAATKAAASKGPPFALVLTLTVSPVLAWILCFAFKFQYVKFTFTFKCTPAKCKCSMQNQPVLSYRVLYHFKMAKKMIQGFSSIQENLQTL